MADHADDLGIPKRLARPASGTSEGKATTPPRPMLDTPVAAPSPLPNLPRFFGSQPPGGAAPARSVNGEATGSSAKAVEPRGLIVGQGISLSGEINSCDRLVIEGSVRANLQGCQHLTIAQTGLFDGNAAIDEADIYGRFEGDLVVHKRLLIRASGQVSGTISYGQIEVEAGGKISGTVSAA
jgi:cytoskeletal protein CcmA (bactofilin family)